VNPIWKKSDKQSVAAFRSEIGRLRAKSLCYSCAFLQLLQLHTIMGNGMNKVLPAVVLQCM